MPTDLLHPLAARVRNPRATHHLGLAHIQRRDPLDHLGLIGLDLHRPRFRTPPTERERLTIHLVADVAGLVSGALAPDRSSAVGAAA